MSSSTSSFSDEWKVLAAVALVLLAGEGLLRYAGPRVSSDIRQIRSLPRRAEKLHAGSGARVLLLGNSLARSGLQKDLFVAETRRLGAPAFAMGVENFNGAEITEWHRMLEENYASPSRRPDVVIVSAAGATSFADKPDVRLGRLAHLTSARRAPVVLADDLEGFGDRAEYAQSLLFFSFASRSGIQDKALERVIPYYDECTRRVKLAGRDRARARQAASGSGPKRTYRRLRRFLRTARHSGITPVLVLMPYAKDYEVPAELFRAAADGAARVLDCRRIDGLTPRHYSDGHHLNADGAGVFSREFAARLVRQHPDVLLGASTGPRTGPGADEG